MDLKGARTDYWIFHTPNQHMPRHHLTTIFIHIHICWIFNHDLHIWRFTGYLIGTSIRFDPVGLHQVHFVPIYMEISKNEHKLYIWGTTKYSSGIYGIAIQYMDITNLDIWKLYIPLN